MFGLDVPLCAFSHSHDVVMEVTRAGGLGVLGTSRYSVDRLDQELTLLDETLDGLPYGVSIIFPARESDRGSISEQEIAAQIPESYWRFLRTLADRFDIPLDLETDEAISIDGIVAAYPLTQERAANIVEVVLNHRVKLVSSALGPPGSDVARQLHDRGVKIAGLIGDPKHVKRQVAAGADLIVATGTEAGGHCGEISSLVLTPQVVEAAGATPVLTAGGVGNGSQLVAALALGAQGVWTGSVWLTTVESDLPEEVKGKLLEASSADTVRSRSLSGRMVRQLRTPWIDAWGEPDAPPPLPPPMQGILVKSAMVGMFMRGNRDVVGTAAGQIIGEISEVYSVKDVMKKIKDEAYRAADRIRSNIARVD
jgi:NAD(P)H-dependent flavin oxidoreductase YrpB (nitropropane dioxygenase family)